MHRVHLHAVHACRLAQLGGLGEGLHQLVDLLLGDGPAHHVLGPAGGQLTGRRAQERGVHDGLGQGAQRLVAQQNAQLVGDGKAAAKTSGKLHEQLGAGGMDLLHVGLQLLEHARVLIQPPAADGVPQRGDAGDDQAHVVVGDVQKELRRHLVEVVGFHPAEQRGAAHGAHHDAVFHLHIADFPGGEQGFITLIHWDDSSSFVAQ